MAKNNAGLGQPTYDYILNMIMTKQLMPGEKIPELKIAHEFGISRSPVRDAMRQLSNEGLITIYPNRFAQVTEYGDNAIHDIGTLRIALDSMAIKLAMLYGSQADFLKLKKIAQECSDALKRKDGSLRRKYDTDFHLELTNLSHNDLLIKFQNELYLRVQFILLHHPNPLENEHRHIHQHFEITQALIDHDEAAALSIILDHLTSFYNLKEHYPPEFFKNILPYPLTQPAG